jgi:hypothetical protein
MTLPLYLLLNEYKTQPPCGFAGAILSTHCRTSLTDLKEAKDALQAQVGHHGYSITVQSSTKRLMFYICSKSGNYNRKGEDPTTHNTKRRKNTITIKTDASIDVFTHKVNDRWRFEVLENNYNYGTAAAFLALTRHTNAVIPLEEHALL